MLREITKRRGKKIQFISKNKKNELELKIQSEI